MKLARSFIEDVAHDHRSEDIVAAVVQLAKALVMVVCAEGVETAEQLEAVHRLGVDLAQGLFGRPIAALRPGYLHAVEERASWGP